MFKLKNVLILAATAVICISASGCAKPQNPAADPKPIYGIDETYISAKDANDDIFSPENTAKRENSALDGKKIYWLGSSVTYGSASRGDSMADYLDALAGTVSKKEAVSGTTIYDDGREGDSGSKSYTRRLTESSVFNRGDEIDAFICQISTNDCTSSRLKYRGSITANDVFAKDSFDRSTTLGGIEYIIAYVTEVWNCPVYFYSGAYFGDGDRVSSSVKGEDYGQFVNEVKAIAEKWMNYNGTQVGVIDMFHDSEFNAAASKEYYAWAQSDAIHPKRAGYLQWWTPYLEHRLITDIG